jgi:hypothetical protein
MKELQCPARANQSGDQLPNAAQYQDLQCREGYTGNLCSKCQVDGEVQYSRLLRFKCARCGWWQ